MQTDLFRNTGEEFYKGLVQAFTKCVRKRKYHSWTSNSALSKQGENKCLGNYHLFTLQSNIYELFSEVLKNKVTNILDETQSREHAGYRSDYLTIDHLQTIDQKQNVTNHFDSC